MSSPKNRLNKEPLVPPDWEAGWNSMSQENKQIYFNTKIGNLYSKMSSWERYTGKPTAKSLHIFLGARVGQGKYTELTFYSVSDNKKLDFTVCHGEPGEQWFLISKKEEE